jgi:hypothetical protein
MTQVALGTFPVTLGQVRFEGGYGRVQDQQSRSRVEAGHHDQLGSAPSTSHQGGV